MTPQLIVEHAKKAAQPFAAANPHVSYDAWVSEETGDAMLKVYLDEAGWGLCCVILVEEINKKPDQTHEIHMIWHGLSEAANKRPLPFGWQRRVFELPTKGHAFVSRIPSHKHLRVVE